MSGTPQSLKEAIETVIRSEAVHTVNDLELSIRDYLSQHFSTAMVKAYYASNRQESEQIVKDLWRAITGKDVV